jgi:predicted nucleotidyltransferase
MRPSEALALHRTEVLRILDDAGVRNPRLFGSTARGDDTEDSDLDLLIDAPPGFTLFDLEGLQQALEALLNVPVDIGTAKFRNERISASVARDARPL